MNPDDIAIIGMDCRFPLAPDPAALWHLLLTRGDAIGAVPRDRWDAERLFDDEDKPGTINHRTGGFLSDADAFDHEFFGMTPKEAAATDPQQRLLLQAAWRALEDATLDPRSQAGSATGVYVGLMANEWAHLSMRELSAITPQSGTGNGYFMTANRLSYQLDLTGPSIAIDTACSSSLVAVHTATAALRAGECDQALAAGVNLILTPAVNAFYTRAGLAAPDGRCKPFSAEANGIGRAEGVAVIVLRRLADAVADRLPIYAVINGGAVNNDGRSNGVTAPNRWAQERVIRGALHNAGVHASQIAFVEAHGTGTILGDMIEAKALGAIHRDRDGAPCMIGSIKGNLGHTEGAAGIAGLMKVVLSLQHRTLPPSRFAEDENPKLRLAAGGLHLVTDPLTLPDEPLFAAVSSFGMGGTNCHIVVGSAPPEAPVPDLTLDPDGYSVLTISSNNAEGLCRNAAQLADAIASSTAPIPRLCWSTNRIKASGKVRAGMVVRSRAEAVAWLREMADPVSMPTAGVGVRAGWLFNGQGTQYPGMSRALHDNAIGYRTALAAVQQAMLPHLGLPIGDILFGASLDSDTALAQPAMFAVQFALARTLLDLGADPAWLIGHSIGEFAVAAIAGALSLDDACRLVVARGRLMQQLPAGGTMLAVRSAKADVSHLITPTLTVAAINGPAETVLSGTRAEIDRVAAELRRRGVTATELPVAHAFHSPLMQPMVAEFADIAAACTFAAPEIPIYSTLRGRLLEPDELMDAEYWAAHITATVDFDGAVTAAMTTQPSHLIELGAKRTLLPMVVRAHPDIAPATLAPIPGPSATGAELADTVARLYRDGLNPRWDRLYRPEVRIPHRLIGYTFSTQHRSWLTTPTAAHSEPLHNQKDSTVDNLIALFREQAAVLTAMTASTGAPPSAAISRAVADPTDLVRREIARISGYPVETLLETQTITSDLGFDSIMVADLNASLRRLAPQAATESGWLTSTATIGDVIAHVGGISGSVPANAEPTVVVEPQSDIAEFPEYVALDNRIRAAEALGIGQPYFLVNDGVTRDTSVIDGAEVANFASFNYLGMSGHPDVTRAVAEATARYGSSCSASRLLSGQKPVHVELEAAIADLLGTEDALTLPSGHATNVTVIGHLFGEPDLVIHDSLAHDSIVQGCKLSGATRRPFPHNDHAALDEILTAIRGRYRRVVILLEGVYSQDGDIPDLPAFISVKKKHKAMLMIDEAHSIGVLGATGAGIGEHFAVDRSDVELWAGTTSKALGGCGGYVAGSRQLIRFLKFTTPGFIFSTGMAPGTAAASVAAIRLLRDEPCHLRRLRDNSELFLRLAKQAGFDTGLSADTPVVPCIVGSSSTALTLSNALLHRGVNANPILYPAVPEDKARLRFFITSCHTEEQLRDAVKILAEETEMLSTTC